MLPGPSSLSTFLMTRVSFGALSGGGMYSGIINNTGGVLTGRDLIYVYENPGVRRMTVGSSYINASAQTFAVLAPVPEPGTWALMLLGFGAIGTALRRALRRTLQRHVIMCATTSCASQPTPKISRGRSRAGGRAARGVRT